MGKVVGWWLLGFCGFALVACSVLALRAHRLPGFETLVWIGVNCACSGNLAVMLARRRGKVPPESDTLITLFSPTPK